MTLAKTIGMIMLIIAAVGYRVAFADYCRRRRRRARREIVTRYRAKLRRAEFWVWRLSVEEFDAEEQRRRAEKRGVIYVKHPAMIEPMKAAMERREEIERTA